MFNIGDRVRLSEQGKALWAKGESNPDCEGTVAVDGFWSDGFTDSVDWDNGRGNSYREGDLELVEPKVDLEVFVEGLNQYQVKELKKLLDTTKVTLYSANGQKWGKKRIPESKLKMTYKLSNGTVKSEIKVENV